MDKLEVEKDEFKEEFWEWKGKYFLEKFEKIGDIRVVILIEGKFMKEV